ncbi:TPA: hypothetical protein JD342_22485 [Citrobacter freundii]|nr:hypothetical protein [Citrobacter freundii]
MFLINKFNRRVKMAVAPRFAPIDNVFVSGMMRVKFELPHGLYSCPPILDPSCFCWLVYFC